MRASILDRLIDNEPHLNSEAEQNKHQQLSGLRNSIRRDLENLLNTRCRIVEPPSDCTELANSQLNYGLPDLATINIADVDKKKQFTAKLESIIKTFEPRFKSVKVCYLDNAKSTDHTVRFRIDATIYADPVPESIIFDSALEPISRTVSVQEV
ncbi:MAG: type VI secretion system baseplate subunit TssE [Pseudomonadota bacterium]